jgi:mono/diheme cytochrome c family protein
MSVGPAATKPAAAQGLTAALMAAATAMFSLLGAAPGHGQGGVTDQMQAERGQRLAAVWCGNCHLVGPAQDGAMRTEAPAFEDIADRPNQSVEALERFLVHPHPPMPDLALSRAQMRELALYIMSLKRAGAGG